jgi:hypothetical protein
MSLQIENIMSAVQSHAMSTGYFDRVNTHEPKNAPGYGLSCAIWLDRLESVRTSGLDSTSARLVLNVRIYTNMVQEPQDMIDINLIKAVDALLDAYNGDFELGGNVRNVDVLGTHGVPLAGAAGYINQDNKLFRVFTINLPLVVNDVWDQNS